ncbi:MAG: DUF481 domain-containing protein [Novosphingobium sp.]
MFAELPAQVIVSAAESSASPAGSELPAGVREVLGAALASGDEAEADAVVRAARRAYPSATETIGQMVAQWKATRLTAAPASESAGPARNAKLRAPSSQAALPVAKITGEGEAGAFANTGNAPGVGLVGGFKLLAEGKNWRIATAARADYQETADVVTREQYRFSTEPNYKFDDRGYIYGLGQFEEDRFQGFASRYSISGGLGYSLLKEDTAKLSVKAGPAWRVTNPVEGERESVVAGLASVEAKLKLTPSLEFNQDASAYVDAKGSTFYTLAALDSRLIGKLKARLSYMVQHETAPELGRLGTDTTSRLTLVYGF